MSALHRNALLDDDYPCLRCGKTVEPPRDYCEECDPLTELLDDPIIGFAGALASVRDELAASFERMNAIRVRRGLLPLDRRTNKPVDGLPVIKNLGREGVGM